MHSVDGAQERLLPLAFCSIIKNDQMEQILFTDINLNPIIAHLNLNSLEIMIRTYDKWIESHKCIFILFFRIFKMIECKFVFTSKN